MFDSPFLSDGSKPIRGAVLTYFSLIIVISSLLYFFVALCWEIRMSQKKGKTKRQIMWSKLKGFKHQIVEDSRNKAKQDKLSRMFNKTKNSPIIRKVLSTRSAVSSINNPQKDDTPAKVVPNSLPQISSSDSNNMSVYSSSSSSRENYTSSSESSSGSSFVSTSDSSNGSTAFDANVYSSTGSSGDNARGRGWSFASSSDREVQLEETMGFQLPADTTEDAQPISISEEKVALDNAFGKISEIADTSEEESLSSSSSSDDTDEISTSSGIITSTVVNGVESSALKNPGADENYDFRKHSVVSVDPDVAAMKSQDNTAGGNGSNQNDHELRQNVSRSRRRSLSSSYDFDFENDVQHRPRRRSQSSSHDFDNEDHIEAKLHKLALATHNDLTDTSSDESDSSSSMSDSSSEKELKEEMVKRRRQRSDSTFEVVE